MKKTAIRTRCNCLSYHSDATKANEQNVTNANVSTGRWRVEKIPRTTATVEKLLRAANETVAAYGQGHRDGANGTSLASELFRGPHEDGGVAGITGKGISDHLHRHGPTRVLLLAERPA